MGYGGYDEAYRKVSKLNSDLNAQIYDLKKVVRILCNNTDAKEAWYNEEEDGRKLLEKSCNIAN